MKKNYLLIGYILMMLMLAGNLFATDYLVSGAGTDAVNGTYVENGTHDEKPKYEFNNGGTIYYLAFDDGASRSDWVIGTTIKACCNQRL